MAGFATLLRLGSGMAPTLRTEITVPLPPGTSSRRRGRSTGLTMRRFSHDIGQSSSLDEAIARLNAEFPA